MTRVGPAEVTRDSEGRVDVELHGRHLIFTRREWEQSLYGPDSTRLQYNSLSWSSSLFPGNGTAGQAVQGKTLASTDWG
jgi:hypothetical protein